VIISPIVTILGLIPYTAYRFFIYTPQAFREPQGQTRGAIEGNAADDALLEIRARFDLTGKRSFPILFSFGLNLFHLHLLALPASHSRPL
jgi:hypothetical protein